MNLPVVIEAHSSILSTFCSISFHIQTGFWNWSFVKDTINSPWSQKMKHWYTQKLLKCLDTITKLNHKENKMVAENVYSAVKKRNEVKHGIRTTKIKHGTKLTPLSTKQGLGLLVQKLQETRCRWHVSASQAPMYQQTTCTVKLAIHIICKICHDMEKRVLWEYVEDKPQHHSRSFSQVHS